MMNEQIPLLTEDTHKRPSLNTLIVVFTVSMLISGVIIFLVLDRFLDNDPPSFNPQVYESEGGVRLIEPPREVSDFTLPAQTGAPLSVSDLQNKVSLIFFGYTHCPDVCPLTMLDYQAVHDQLGASASEVAFVYISVDGDRDTPQVLSNYFERRNMQDFMIGLSGDENTLSRISPEYNLYYTLNDPDETGYYTVDHTASIYMLDTEGRLARIFAYGTEPEVITETVRGFLAGDA